MTPLQKDWNRNLVNTNMDLVIKNKYKGLFIFIYKKINNYNIEFYKLCFKEWMNIYEEDLFYKYIIISVPVYQWYKKRLCSLSQKFILLSSLFLFLLFHLFLNICQIAWLFFTGRFFSRFLFLYNFFLYLPLSI